ncbi:hypothetical protein IWQ62_001898 [Dispira parvispora]|uniref:Uncharacterized protein n=1 Tax=Dispira parvispora TaxID=1520584 RepID=A0A9W8E3B2_9FUNG|nr:hypothetical protein IWQ62_001898 [Dispira parvispora]
MSFAQSKQSYTHSPLLNSWGTPEVQRELDELREVFDRPGDGANAAQGDPMLVSIPLTSPSDPNHRQQHSSKRRQRGKGQVADPDLEVEQSNSPAEVKTPQEAKRMLARRLVGRLKFLHDRKNVLAMRNLVEMARERGIPVRSEALGMLVSGYLKVGNIKSAQVWFVQFVEVASYKYIKRWVFNNLLNRDSLWAILEGLEKEYGSDPTRGHLSSGKPPLSGENKVGRGPTRGTFPDLQLLNPILALLSRHNQHPLLLVVYRRFVRPWILKRDTAMGSDSGATRPTFSSEQLQTLFELLLISCMRYGTHVSVSGAISQKYSKTTTEKSSVSTDPTYPVNRPSEISERPARFESNVLETMLDIFTVDMAHVQVPLTRLMTNPLIKMGLESHRHEVVSQVLDKMYDEGLALDSQDYNTLIHGCVLNDRLDAALLLYHYMTDSHLTQVLGTMDHPVLQKLALHPQSALPWLDRVLPRVEQHEPPAGDTAGEVPLYRVVSPPRNAHTANLHPDRYTENIVTSGYLKQGLVRDANDRIQQQLASNASHDTTWYIQAFRTLSQHRQFGELMALYKRMRVQVEQDLPQGATGTHHRYSLLFTAYIALLRILVRQNKVETAQAVYDDMVDDYFAHQSIWSQRQLKSGNPSFKDRRQMGKLKHSAIVSQGRKARQVKAESKATPSTSASSPYVSTVPHSERQLAQEDHSSLHHTNTDSGAGLDNRHRRQTSGKPVRGPTRPGVDIHNLFLKVYFERRQFAKAVAIYRRMIQLGVIPNAETWCLILRALDQYSLRIGTMTAFLNHVVGPPQFAVNSGEPPATRVPRRSEGGSRPTDLLGMFAEPQVVGHNSPLKLDLNADFIELLIRIFVRRKRPDLALSYCQLIESRLEAGTATMHGQRTRCLSSGIKEKLAKLLSTHSDLADAYPQWYQGPSRE